MFKLTEEDFIYPVEGGNAKERRKNIITWIIKYITKKDYLKY